MRFLQDIGKLLYMEENDRSMEKYVILYNPLSCSGKGWERAKRAEELIGNADITYRNVTDIDDIGSFVESLPRDVDLIFAGGDGTVNHFVNAVADICLDRDVYYFGAGTGNDFLNDIGADCTQLVHVNKYIENLPVVEVKGKKYKFLNNVGFGIDGYCTEEGDKQRAAGKQKINYTTIALKGLLFKYKKVNATVKIDGVVKSYKNVWLAPTMNGRYFGGGMMACPEQDRLCEDGKVTLMVMHCPSRLKVLTIFPSIFKGEHVKHTNVVEQYKGYNVEVTFDRPCALQIDGETITDVLSYKVWAGPEYRKAGLKELEEREAVIQ